MVIPRLRHIEEKILTMIELIKPVSAGKMPDVMLLDLHFIDTIHTGRRSALCKKKCYSFDWYML